MKKVIRKCVFETNSSMSHSCIIMTKEQSDKWEKEDLYLYRKGYWNPFKDLAEKQQPVDDQFYTQEEVLDFIKLISDEEYNIDEDDYYNIDDYIREMTDGCFISYNKWRDNEYEELDTNIYTTPGGETVVVYCSYGRDG